MRILVADTETGGTDPAKQSLLQIGAVAGNLETGEIYDSLEHYLKLPKIEDYVIEEEAAEKHAQNLSAKLCFTVGLTKEELAVKFTDLYYKNNCVLLGGHNVDFDVDFISTQIFGCSRQTFKDNFTYRILDSNSIIRLFAGVDDMKQGSTLKQTVKALGIETGDIQGAGFHSALYDSIVSFRILHKFRRVLTLPSVVRLLTEA